MPISQLVALVIAPLGTSLVGGIIALLLAWRRRGRLAAYVGALSVAWLWAWSTPVLSLSVRSHLEGGTREVAPSQVPVFDAMVVLGGTVDPPARRDGAINLGKGADRVWYAARLYADGKAPLVLLSGGSDPGESPLTEAEAMQVFLRDLGVPDTAMVLEKRSRTTHENAVESAAMLGERGISRVLLVTSAMHMRRAACEFRRQGIDVIEAPTDFEAQRIPPAPRRYLPDADALEGSGRAIKELLGQQLACR